MTINDLEAATERLEVSLATAMSKISQLEKQPDRK